MDDDEDHFLKAIIEVSVSLAGPVVLSVTGALEALPRNAARTDRLAVAELAPHPSSRDALKRLLQLWMDSYPNVDQNSIAWALKSASAMNEYHRSTQSMELVWTGPAHSSIHLRRTDQALYEVVNEANESLILATFAAFKTPELDRALLRAAARGVSITMIVESSEIAEGKIKFGAFEGLRESVLEKVAIYIWPLERREKDKQGNFGVLHAKCAVADGQSALISSANLTGFAFSLNMELGLLIRGGEVPKQIADSLAHLIDDGTLVEWSTRPSV